MAREWQQTTYKEFVMPNAVYYQTLWAVRDLYRMEERLELLKANIEGGNPSSTSLIKDGNRDYYRSRPTEKHAMEKMVLETRINAIRSAMDEIPTAMKPHIIKNVMKKTGGARLPNSLWRSWKQKFLYQVAINLSIM